MFRKPHLPAALGVIFAVAMAACESQPVPSGPGTASLRLDATRGACNSFGGCAYVVRLNGPGGQSEADFELTPEGPDLVLRPGFPLALAEGDYAIAFELRFMSDAISDNGPRDFGIGATCGSAFKVGPGRSVIRVRVDFGADSCAVSVASEQLDTSIHPGTGIT